jgi:hypothetical protein
VRQYLPVVVAAERGGVGFAIAAWAAAKSKGANWTLSTGVRHRQGDTHERIFDRAAHRGRPRFRLGAPNLPAWFTDTFTSRYIDTGELRLHAVIGGEGSPQLLVHGWPETWYSLEDS